MNSTSIFSGSFNRKTFFVYGVFLALLFSSTISWSQNFISKQDGVWNQNTTWNSTHSCGQSDNVSAGIPPINKGWGCAVSVVINHNVEFTGNANNFGANVFNGITIKSGASLHFSGNVTISGGGSVPTFILESGATMNVAGTFTVNRPVKIVIPSNSVVTIKNLVVGDSRPEITVQEGGKLIILETTELKSQSTLNVHGSLHTKNLSFTSGGTLNADHQGAQIIVDETTTLVSNSTLNLNGILNTNNLIFTSGGKLNANSDQAKIEVAKDLTVSNGTLSLSQSSSIQVNGKANAGQSGTISLTHSASASFEGLVTIPNGATIKAANSSHFRFGNNVDMSGGGKLELRNNAEGIIQGDVSLPNGKIETFDYSEVYVGGKLTASNGGEVSTFNNSAFNICDYPNSTQLGTYHIKMLQNSFYGEGCFALPVIWGAFTAQFDPSKKQSNIVWETTKEWENSHFEVERSLSGVDGYTVVGEISAVGYSDLISSYMFEDQAIPIHKGFVYYRIKQVDLNGKYAYSETVSVMVQNISENSTASKWVAYPNPTSGDGFNLKLTEASNTDQGPITARIISLRNSQSVQATDLSMLSLLIGQQISQAPKGVCVIEVIQGNEVTHLKILKH
ncbi:translocation/assembly module TamB domain-containing protein [Lunatibacter salilacus]|uniref:hypothetical protein n=1 Tax=Lunatibacter salilacus TaxID=2483804 RepID=UPI00131B0CD7|nr:hypothetical protein [Lunatibacter salilacus]